LQGVTELDIADRLVEDFLSHTTRRAPQSLRAQ
jgi:hypothetical protein